MDIWVVVTIVLTGVAAQILLLCLYNKRSRTGKVKSVTVKCQGRVKKYSTLEDLFDDIVSSGERQFKDMVLEIELW
jgi:hypothetical protein